MSGLPVGTLTFVFTDIEGSTASVGALGERAWRDVLVDHAVILRRAFTAHGGREVRTEGDSFFFVFASAPAAVAACAAAQRALAGHAWPHGAAVRVRMGLHAGEAAPGGEESGVDYVGFDVHRAARVAAAGHGGQVLLSETARSLAVDELPAGVSLRDLGEHRLKDLSRPERLHQLDIEGLEVRFPRLRTLEAARHNLPVQLTTFIGRERELAEARRLLEGTRLLTLVGPGGTGKTRLALQIASESAERFPGGVAFVALAPIRDPDLVPPTIAHALGIQLAGAAPPLEQVIAYLRDRRTLLVLDNFEQVAAAATQVAELLRSAPDTAVVVTSRSALGLSGEQEFPVPPLELADPGLADAPAVAASEAARLFAERARAVKPDFAITGANASVIAAICVRLDGLPLAIELAAARVKLLSPAAILERLGSRLALLAGGVRDLPERQRSLRGAIGWSYDLLEQSERRLFERFSVFVGGAELEQIAVVCGPEEEIGGDVLEGLAALADKSLLVATPREAEPRFSMLETIRDFALERLDEAGEHAPTARRHAEAYRDLAEHLGPHAEQRDGARTLDRLDRDHDNLRAALRWSLDTAAFETGFRAARALGAFWHLRDHAAEGRRWLEALLAAPEGRVPNEVRVQGFLAASRLAGFHGDNAAELVLSEAALRMSRELGDKRGAAEAASGIGYALLGLGRDPERSASLFEEAFGLYEELGDQLGIAEVQRGIGTYALHRGDVETARRRVLASLEAYERAGDQGRETYYRLFTLLALSRVEQLSGDHAAALARARDALRVASGAGAAIGTAAALELVAHLLLDVGDLERAIRLGAAAERVRADIGGGVGMRMAGLPPALERARTLVGAEDLERARAEGRRLGRDEAVSEALGA